MTMDVDSTGSPGGYAGFQLARALAAAGSRQASVREGAAKRLRQWLSVIDGHRDGSITTGSRTPVKDTPAWATLEVVTGGFATGALLAGGPLQPHERALRTELAPDAPDADTRLALNSFFLSDPGLERLQAMLATGRFDIELPEEGALLVVAWLVQAGHAEDAWELVAKLLPWFSRLRFYPHERAEAPADDERLWVDDAATAARGLRAMKPNQRILAQKEAIEIWAPIHDRMAGLMLETVSGDLPIAQRTAAGAWQHGEAGKFVVTGGWPCAHYPDGWRERALALLAQFEAAREAHPHCNRPERKGDSFSTLREGLLRCVDAPDALTGRDVGRIRLVLARYVAKHGPSESAARIAWREQQRSQISGATFAQIAGQIAQRLDRLPPDEGLDDVAPVLAPIDDAEPSGIPSGMPVPPTVRRKVGRALKGTAAELVERGIIPSGEVLARVLPRWAATLSVADVADPALRRLHAAIYRAFRRRRSLLLVNLQHQVRIGELPWVAAIESFRAQDEASRRAAHRALTEVSQLALGAFPQAVLPNKLLQEMTALGEAAGLRLPLTEEVAADIFMGRFSPKFLSAAKVAASMLRARLYARYYDIDCDALIATTEPAAMKTEMRWDSKPDALARLCASRAGVVPGSGGTVANGMLIEQAQILTTHNLAVLFTSLDLGEQLAPRLPDMARRCFNWICLQLQIPVEGRHARLIQIKNSAYAWRQMIFFLSLCAPDEIDTFMGWAKGHLDAQGHEFKRVFAPALSDLALVAAAHLAGVIRPDIQPFFGWSQEKHWLMLD